VFFFRYVATIVAAVAHGLTYPLPVVQTITVEGRIDDVTRSRFDLSATPTSTHSPDSATRTDCPFWCEDRTRIVTSLPDKARGEMGYQV
jgi:hypothetical protein